MAVQLKLDLMLAVRRIALARISPGSGQREVCSRAFSDLNALHSRLPTYTCSSWLRPQSLRMNGDAHTSNPAYQSTTRCECFVLVHTLETIQPLRSRCLRRCCC